MGSSWIVGRRGGMILSLLLCSMLQACGGVQGSIPGHGEPLPDFELALLGGGRLGSDDLQGGDLPIVLNFWATWCGPCVREIPALKELHRSGEVKVISISLDTSGESVVKPFVEEKQIDYPVLLGNMELFHKLGGNAIPYTLVLDPELRIAAAHKGLVTKNTLDRGLADAMASAR